MNIVRHRWGLNFFSLCFCPDYNDWRFILNQNNRTNVQLGMGIFSFRGEKVLQGGCFNDSGTSLDHGRAGFNSLLCPRCRVAVVKSLSLSVLQLYNEDNGTFLSHKGVEGQYVRL